MNISFHLISHSAPPTAFGARRARIDESSVEASTMPNGLFKGRFKTSSKRHERTDYDGQEFHVLRSPVGGVTIHLGQRDGSNRREYYVSPESYPRSVSVVKNGQLFSKKPGRGLRRALGQILAKYSDGLFPPKPAVMSKREKLRKAFADPIQLPETPFEKLARFAVRTMPNGQQVEFSRTAPDTFQMSIFLANSRVKTPAWDVTTVRIDPTSRQILESSAGQYIVNAQNEVVLVPRPDFETASVSAPRTSNRRCRLRPSSSEPLLPRPEATGKRWRLRLMASVLGLKSPKRPVSPAK